MNLKKRVNPIVAVIVAALVLVGIGVIGATVFSNSSGGTQMIVKPSNPDDPKFKPNPNLGLAGGNN